MIRAILITLMAAALAVAGCSSFKKNPAQTATARATYDLFPEVAPNKEPKRKKVKIKRSNPKAARAAARYRGRIRG
ncbi:MAG TPA: hypothetical protein VD927_15110 [Chryseosolibacter sp.]|nr:hypothetical protein [Chryseosolibacter sp.]